MNSSYAVIIEKGPTNFGAYLPDLPGCVALADTEEKVWKLIVEAVDLHVETMQENGEPIPEPQSSARVLKVEIPGVTTV